MAKKKKMLPIDRIKYDKEGTQVDINLSRFERQFQKAQFGLDTTVMQSMIPFMPMQTSSFINVTMGMSMSIAGTGKVYAAAPPMGRFLYEGKVMIGVRTRSPFAAYGEKKVVTSKNLQYSQHAHPRVTDHWFESSKEAYGDVWIRKTKQIAGGGTNGGG